MNHRYLRHILGSITLVVFVGLIIAVEVSQKDPGRYQPQSVVVKVSPNSPKSETLRNIQQSLEVTTSDVVKYTQISDDTFLMEVKCKPEKKRGLLRWLLNQHGVEDARSVD